MIKVHNIHIGAKSDLYQLNDDWAFVHACKTSHKERLGYTKPPKNEPYYIEFREQNHLYINWVDEPTGEYFKIKTFHTALNFIDEYIQKKEIFIHCDLGQSRAPTLGLVYLSKRTDFLDNDYDQALEKFTECYPNFNPSGITKFVKINWDQIQ